MYYRLEALHRAGMHITLHCFTYGRSEAPALEECCDRVYYYRRNMSPWLHLRREPFIVSSRDNDELLQRLQRDNAPILIEGLHGCALLRRLRQQESEGEGRHRTVIVRAHNVEQDYYRLLAQSERRLLRKAYLALEARKLRRYEPTLKLADAVLAITDADADRFRQMGCSKVLTIPPFLPPLTPSKKKSQFSLTNNPQPIICLNSLITFSLTPNNFNSPFVLYHADLSIPDNEWAVRWLQRNVMRHVDHPFVVAGRSPRPALRRFLARFPNTWLLASPSQHEMDALVAGARCTVMITRQPTGFKLKLVNSLSLGQHCLVNSAMVAGTGLAGCCHVADTAEAMREKLEQLMQVPFDENLRQQRQLQLSRYFDNTDCVRQIAELL